MTIFTKPLTTAAEKLNNLAEHKTRAANLEQAREALKAFGLKDGLSTPFTEGGDIRTELADTELAGNFRQAEARFNEAKQDRDTLLKGAAITAGSIAGTAIGGLAMREAHRRGWIAGALREVNKRLVPKAIAKQHGKIAGTAARLVMEGQAVAIVQVNGDEETSRWEGHVRITGAGFVIRQLPKGEESQTEILIPFGSLTEVTRITNYQRDGNQQASVATLYVTEHIPLNA